MKIDLVKDSTKFDRKELYRMRVNLVQVIDPLRSEGSDLKDILLKCNRISMGEENLS